MTAGQVISVLKRWPSSSPVLIDGETIARIEEIHRGPGARTFNIVPGEAATIRIPEPEPEPEAVPETPVEATVEAIMDAIVADETPEEPAEEPVKRGPGRPRKG